MTNIIQVITFKTRFSFNMTNDRPSFITSIMKLKNQCVRTHYDRTLAFSKTSISQNTDWDGTKRRKVSYRRPCVNLRSLLAEQITDV